MHHCPSNMLIFTPTEAAWISPSSVHPLNVLLIHISSLWACKLIFQHILVTTISILHSIPTLLMPQQCSNELLQYLDYIKSHIFSGINPITDIFPLLITHRSHMIWHLVLISGCIRKSYAKVHPCKWPKMAYYDPNTSYHPFLTCSGWLHVMPISKKWK